MRIRHVVGKRTRFGFPQGILASFQNVILRGRFAMSPLMKQVGAEKRAFRLFKEGRAGIPTRAARAESAGPENGSAQSLRYRLASKHERADPKNHSR